MKPKVYIETSVPSYLAARRSQDVRVLANQETTIEWWDNRRTHFELFVSEFVLTEAALGDPTAAQKRLAFLDGITVLDATNDVRSLGSALVAEGPIPPQAAIDALHIAIAAVAKDRSSVPSARVRAAGDLYAARTDGGVTTCGKIRSSKKLANGENNMQHLCSKTLMLFLRIFEFGKLIALKNR